MIRVDFQCKICYCQQVNIVCDLKIVIFRGFQFCLSQSGFLSKSESWYFFLKTTVFTRKTCKSFALVRLSNDNYIALDSKSNHTIGKRIIEMGNFLFTSTTWTQCSQSSFLSSFISLLSTISLSNSLFKSILNPTPTLLYTKKSVDSESNSEKLQKALL